MPSMQHVSFNNVEAFLDFLPDDEFKLVEILRKIVFDCIPDATEKLSYNVPYYKRHKNICFIWPSSILWGNKKTYDGVRFGFTNGYRLTDGLNYLDKGDRKQVYWKDFKNVKEINIDLLKSFIFEAAEIDDRQKRSIKKK
jgi:hypothetical protein